MIKLRALEDLSIQAYRMTTHLAEVSHAKVAESSYL